MLDASPTKSWDMVDRGTRQSRCENQEKPRGRQQGPLQQEGCRVHRRHWCEHMEVFIVLLFLYQIYNMKQKVLFPKKASGPMRKHGYLSDGETGQLIKKRRLEPTLGYIWCQDGTWMKALNARAKNFEENLRRNMRTYLRIGGEGSS